MIHVMVWVGAICRSAAVPDMVRNERLFSLKQTFAFPEADACFVSDDRRLLSLKIFVNIPDFVSSACSRPFPLAG